MSRFTNDLEVVVLNNTMQTGVLNLIGTVV